MDRQYVGIDFHRRRSVIVRVSAAGEKLSGVRVANDPLAIAAAVAEAGPDPEVVVEATYRWSWVGGRQRNRRAARGNAQVEERNACFEANPDGSGCHQLTRARCLEAIPSGDDRRHAGSMLRFGAVPFVQDLSARSCDGPGHGTRD
jgi:hypothetical protein